MSEHFAVELEKIEYGLQLLEKQQPEQWKTEKEIATEGERERKEANEI